MCITLTNMAYFKCDINKVNTFICFVSNKLFSAHAHSRLMTGDSLYMQWLNNELADLVGCSSFTCWQPVATSIVISGWAPTCDSVVCCWWGFVLLYCCLHTLREQYRLQQCYLAGTTTTHLWSSEVWSGSSELWDKPSGGGGGVPTVTVRTHGNFIMLPHMDMRPLAMTCYPTQSYYPDTE